MFNGDWSIDYPGNYSAGGTNVMYTRSARSQSSSGEQILIMGPTTVDLDVKVTAKSFIFLEPAIKKQKVIKKKRSQIIYFC